jgi:NADPH:quinone reductase
MNAIRIHEYGGPEVMRLEDVSLRDPGPDEVLVRLLAAGVNPVDTYLRTGAQGYAPDLPFTPGMDGAGEVAAVGERVDDLEEGERVYVVRSITGTYAEMALCRREHVFSLPEAISFEEGACLGVPYGTAMRAIVDKAGLSYGETVLVHGASGGVGTAAVQIARAMGAHVVGTAGTAAGLELVLEHGATAAFSHRDPQHLEQALEWTNGRGFDVVLEMAAERNLGEVLKVLAPGGRVVVIGSRGDVDITPRDLMKREAQVRGMSLMNATPGELARLHERIRAGLERKELRPVVREVLPLRGAATAHEHVMASGARGNIVLRIR